MKQVYLLRQNLWICSPLPQKAKGLNKVSLKNEEGELRTFYMISLRGLPPDVILSMRRVSLAYNITVEQNENQLQASEQITATQGQDWFSFASKGHIDKVRPFRMQGKSSLISGGALLQLQQKLQTDREEGLGPSQENEEDEVDPLDDMDGSNKEEV